MSKVLKICYLRTKGVVARTFKISQRKLSEDGVQIPEVSDDQRIAELKSLLQSREQELKRREHGEILTSVLDFVSLLQPIASIHPLSGVVFNVFAQVIELEVEREKNDGIAMTVIKGITDMIFDFTSLKNLSPANMDQARFRSLCEDMKVCIFNSGNAIDFYYRTNIFVKYCRATSWKDQLTGFLNDFGALRLKFLVVLQLNATSNATSNNQDILRAVNKQTEILQEALKNQSEFAKDLEDSYSKFDKGNIKRDVLEGKIESYLRKTESDFEGEETIERRKREIMKTLTMSLDDQFKQNEATFMSALDALSVNITKALDASEKRVTNFIGDIFGNINKKVPKDFRDLWVAMQWRHCVEKDTFVIGLREFYAGNISSENDALEGEFILSGESWTEKYLSDEYSREIVDAIDQDGSGYITLREINKFVLKKPASYSLPVWIAYWAEGWAVEASIYRFRIERLVYEMINLCQSGKLYVENLLFARLYLEDHKLSIIDTICRSVNDKDTFDIYLRTMVQNIMVSREKRLNDCLKKVKYHINDLGTLRRICDKDDFKVCALPLLYLILRHHYNILTLCTEKIISKTWLRGLVR